MNKTNLINEVKFDLNYINKYASLMTIGNGYLGMRATHEETYGQQVRGHYIAGIYNKATENDVAEIVNLPDIIGMKIEINGEAFSLQSGQIYSYNRSLDMSNGELVRELLWENSNGMKFEMKFQRFVGKNNLHLFASKVTIKSLDGKANIKIITGIDAQETNFGRQHLEELSVRVYNEEVMQGVYKTTQSKEVISIAQVCNYSTSNHVSFTAKNRQLNVAITAEILQEEAFVFEKKASIYTSLEDQNPEKSSLDLVNTVSKCSYDDLKAASATAWEQFWNENGVEISSINSFDQVAINFALYHLEIMTPSHDERLSVGAKGLTGEGYKGHVFWDTEIFIAPFHLFTQPERMKQLLCYRYLNLDGAFEKSEKNGYEGALFPWESAFTGYEETPEYAAINIKTGKRQKVASALAEHHIVADIAYAVSSYYRATQDDVFMKKEGLTLLKETARFWISRSVTKEGQMYIEDVIGPDEYTEHIDNNAYTNYLACYNVEQALHFMKKYNDIEDDLFKNGQNFIDTIYLPQPNSEGLIPQDDTFLNKPQIDLTKYKKNQGSQGILLDYSRAEVNELQILKQADVVMLMYLMPHLFDAQTMKKNLAFYEERTIHDSSLSKAIHAIVANWCHDNKSAYQFFKEACLIDLGPNPTSSDEGIHAASLGAIWLATIFGFAGVQPNKEILEINSNLPSEWKSLSFPFVWNSERLQINMTHEMVEIKKETDRPLSLKVNGQDVVLSDQIKVQKDELNLNDFEAVIFDLDGVITDTAEYHYLAWKKLGEELGINFEREFNETLKGISRMESLERILELGNRENDFTIEEKEVLAAKKNKHYIELIKDLTPKDILPGIREFLQQIKDSNMKIGMASASKNAFMVTEALQLQEYFDHIVDAAKVANSKPHPEVFLKAAKALGVAPEKCIGIEDAVAGVTSINDANMFSIAIGTDLGLKHAKIVLPSTEGLNLEMIRRAM